MCLYPPIILFFLSCLKRWFIHVDDVMLNLGGGGVAVYAKAQHCLMLHKALCICSSWVGGGGVSSPGAHVDVCACESVTEMGSDDFFSPPPLFKGR